MDDIVPFPKLAQIEQYSVDYSQLGNDYIFARLLPSNKDFPFLREPVRFSGLTLCLVLDGELSVEINTRQFELKRRSLMVLSSNTVLHITDVDWSAIDAYVLFISPQFISDVSIDLNSISMQSLIKHEPSPIMQLSDQEEKLFAEYMDLLHHNACVTQENPYTKNIARSLIQAAIYQLMEVSTCHSVQDSSQTTLLQNRHLNYVQEFMRLVQIHHFKERSLSFYADKLCISPKYLSRIIKETTGRSAAEWIDRFVILEAKNMLRFSNKNIQQVAYALNFSTQSSFGKFFKHLTGMSPSEYQKT